MQRAGKGVGYREKKKEIVENVRKLKSRGSNLQLDWGEINDFEDGEFYDFSAISNSKGEDSKRFSERSRK